MRKKVANSNNAQLRELVRISTELTDNLEAEKEKNALLTAENETLRNENAIQKDDIEHLRSENEKMREELGKFIKEEKSAKSATNPSSEITSVKNLGVKTVSTSERLNRSKLPPHPQNKEFDTDYTIYTDGACLGNGRPGLGYGGWGYVIVDNATGNEYEMSGNAGPDTTNQVMEITAVKSGVDMLSTFADEDATVMVCSDSQYVINGITKWSPNWKQNGWTNSKGQPVANKNLWLETLGILEDSNLTVNFSWVKGHNEHYYNSLCDLLATTAAADKAKECNCHMFDENIPTY